VWDDFRFFSVVRRAGRSVSDLNGGLLAGGKRRLVPFPGQDALGEVNALLKLDQILSDRFQLGREGFVAFP
jgi:hypothetical protein